MENMVSTNDLQEPQPQKQGDGWMQSSAGMEAGGRKDGGVDGQTDREDESMEGRASQGPVLQVALL